MLRRSRRRDRRPRPGTSPASRRRPRLAPSRATTAAGRASASACVVPNASGCVGKRAQPRVAQRRPLVRRAPAVPRSKRVAGIEPAWPAWKAGALPLSYTRARPSRLAAVLTRRMPGRRTSTRRSSSPPSRCSICSRSAGSEPRAAGRLLRGARWAAGRRVLDAAAPSRPALPADGAPAAERDPRRVGAASRRPRRFRRRWRRRSRAGALARRSSHPAVALPLWLANYYVWHVPPVYDAALDHQAWLIHIEHACYFAHRLRYVVAARPRRPAAPHSGARAAYAFAAFVLASPIGLLLALLPKPVYAFYVHAPTARLGADRRSPTRRSRGVTMAAEQAIVLFVDLPVLVPAFPRRGGAELLETAGDAVRGRRRSGADARASRRFPAAQHVVDTRRSRSGSGDTPG